MFQIKLSESTAARRRIPILLVDATDGYTPETGITTPTIKVSKNGGTQATGTGTFTEIGTGQYYYEFASGEVDTLGWVTFNLQKAGCRDYNAIIQVMAYDAMDAVRLGLTALPNANAASAGGLLTSGTGSHQINASAGVVDANAIQISGDATAADNLESAADGTGYNLGGGSIVAASVTGAVGSVTGAVGSVTGNVGGNVAGSVNSVTTGVTVATNNDKTGYSLATAPPTSADIADAVWDEPMSGHTTADTYGGRIPRSQNSNVEVQITGSRHIAADVHEFQPDVINAAAIAAGAIDASALATDAVTEIAQGVLSEATSTNTGVYAAGDVGNILGRLHNMIEADGADFRYTTNALEQAPSGGGGGGGSTTVRMGPFEVRAEGQASDLPLDINKTATHGIDCVLVDAQGTGVDLTGATLSTKVYNTAGTLVATITGTATYAAGGAMTWTIPTSVTNTAGTYTATITRTTGASDTEVFGPLRIYVRDI